MDDPTDSAGILDEVTSISKSSVGDGSVDLLSGLTEKPPDDILDFEEEFGADPLDELVDAPPQPLQQMDVDVPAVPEQPEVDEGHPNKDEDHEEPSLVNEEQPDDTESTMTASERQDSEKVCEENVEENVPADETVQQTEEEFNVDIPSPGDVSIPTEKNVEEAEESNMDIPSPEDVSMPTEKTFEEAEESNMDIPSSQDVSMPTDTNDENIEKTQEKADEVEMSMEEKSDNIEDNLEEELCEPVPPDIIEASSIGLLKDENATTTTEVEEAKEEIEQEKREENDEVVDIIPSASEDNTEQMKDEEDAPTEDVETSPVQTTKQRGKAAKQEKKKTPAPVVETPPSVRRSSRANKGIGKEIFDPSYIPKSKMPSLDPPKRHSSPASDHSSTFSSPGSGRGRGRKSIPASPSKPSKSSDETQKTETASKEKKTSAASAKARSREDFSDDEDNVPLKQLKSEEDEDYKDEESEPESEEISSSDEDSDDSYNNPDRLWCICQKPHNNRFMISCDKCEEWFHGDCVGITLQRGKKMEEKGEEYICPKCVKKSENAGTPKKQKAPQRKTVKEVKKVPSKTADSRKRSISSEDASKRSLKTFALKGQIQRSGNSRGESAPQKKKLKVFDEKSEKKPSQMTAASQKKSDDGKPSRKCIVSSCENPALPGSVYCSNQCILRHAKESLKSIAKDKEQGIVKLKLMKRESNPNTHNRDQKDRVSVHCRRTNKILIGNSAPHRRDLAAFLKAHPSYEVYRPRPRPSPNHDKTPSKQTPSGDVSGKAVTSLDFYRHVEVQNRKRDRYGTDPDYAPPVKKISEGGATLLDKKQKSASNVVKIINQGPMTSSAKLVKKRDSTETAKKIEGPNQHHQQRIFEKKKIEAKEQRRKSSAELTSEISDRPAKKERTGSLSKGDVRPSSSQGSTSDVRQNVKKTLLEILAKRSETSDDLKMHRDSIARLATKVEESLFKVFGDTNMKYKNKYRSIMFNLKDTRNQGLWRKVIIGDVSTSELVQMSAEQMASKKLAEWRKMELSHELDIIEKQEKEEANVRPVAKITHKGEIAIQEDLSDLTVTTVNLRDNINNPTVAPARKKRSSLSEEDPFDPNSLSSPDDTTLKHREHLFDLNCKICTGKIKEEDVEFPEEESSKKIKSSSSIILSTEAQKASKSLLKSPPKSQLFKPDGEKKKVKKAKSNRNLSDSRSHDHSLSPSSFLHKRSKSPTPEKKKMKKKPVLPTPPPLSDLAPHANGDVAKETKIKSPEVKEEKTPPPVMEKDDAVVEEPSPPALEDPPMKKVSRSQPIWSGNISMLELSTFKANVYPVTGNCENLDIDLPPRLVLGGRIHPKVVWDYLLKVKALPTKQLSIIRFHAASDDDRVGYVAMLSYFSSRKRFGVVSNQDRLLLKDMYLIPLLESQPIPGELAKTLSGEDLEEALPPHRPSMLLGVIVRQASKPIIQQQAAEVKKPQQKVEEEKVKIQSGGDKTEDKEADEDEEEEYVPDEDPLIPDKVPVPLTDEEVGSKSSSKSGSLFERNKSLAPSLRFFMRKASEEEQSIREQQDVTNPTTISEDKEDEGGDYDPTDAVGEDETNDDEPYDPEQEEEYDPETAFPDKEEDAPYDPEEDDEMMKKQDAKEMDELVEKQAYLEKMQRELEEKKAKLAEVEQNLQKSAATVTQVESQRVDPRMAARRAAKDKEEKPVPPAPVVEPPKNPLQTILSALNMSGGNPTSSSSTSGFLSMFQKKESTPPPLPDSTTKSDAEEAPDEEQKLEKHQEKSGLVSYESTPDSTQDDVSERKREEDERTNKKGRRKEERRHRSTSSSSTSSREGSSYRRRRHDSGGHHDDRRHRKSGRRSRSRSPSNRSRRHRQESPRHHRRHDDRRSWSRDRRR